MRAIKEAQKIALIAKLYPKHKRVLDLQVSKIPNKKDQSKTFDLNRFKPRWTLNSILLFSSLIDSIFILL